MSEAQARAWPAAVFFDLDGTLADTADDLAAPVNAMRIERGLKPLAVADLRPYASMGARGLIGRGLGVERGHPEFDALRDDFLARYETAMCVHTRLFPGMDEVLAALERHRIPWGVVSNKFERYVKRILAALGLDERAIAAIGGDTTRYAKPHPEPLLHAARLTGVAPAEAYYVGDDLRDVEAGRAAGMRTIVAAYGFCGDALPPHQWGGDFLVESPAEIPIRLGLVR
ncbi:MAG: HAD-IA family hydrolase [Burkholderiales bacterium]|nr:MAG: HAD-IA family hydrolase [Burkholderiales bacterium]